MKFFKLTTYITLLLFVFAGLTSNAQIGAAVVAPETTITVEEARENRDRFLASTDIDFSTFTYDYEELKKFVNFIESEKAKGVDVAYITVYLSQYKNGEKTAFIAPLKADGTPNYDVKVLNHGGVSPPMTSDGKTSGKIRY